MSKENKIRVRFSISAKLITIISLVVVLSLGSITFLVSYFVSNDVRVTAENNNLTVNNRSALSAQNSLNVTKNNVLLLLDLLNTASGDNGIARQAETFFFERNQDVAAIVLLSQDNLTQAFNYDLRLINNKFFSSNELDVENVDTLIVSEAEEIEKSFHGELSVLNASPFMNYATIAMIIPWKEAGINQVAVVISSSENLTDSFGNAATSTSFMINSRGDVLVHPDYEMVRLNVNLSSSPLVVQMRDNNDQNRQILFTDQDGIEYFGAYQKLNIGDLGVLTVIESSIVFENVRKTTQQNIYLTLAVLFTAVLFIWIYSKTLSHPLKKLTAASEQIEAGHYDIVLKPRGHDELSVLTQSFSNMSQGLAERERLKDTFGRFINKDIAEKAARGELSLGGETKNVTVFFSDIRSFTAISEKLEPYEVVGFLNDYMTRMVGCVNKTGGVVDKFIGDAVMAVWGAPVSTGDTAQDALNCVRAALMMRFALRQFNVGRGGDKKPIIRIGCGINTGPVIAGQIGSNERMEYTVIGDTVNFASRTESLNKPLHTDILITENTYNLIKNYVLVEQMPSVTVKGKSEPVHMYAVINMPYATDIPGAGVDGPKTLAEVRALLGVDAPDLSTVNLDEEEKKYKIKGTSNQQK